LPIQATILSSLPDHLTTAVVLVSVAVVAVARRRAIGDRLLAPARASSLFVCHSRLLFSEARKMEKARKAVVVVKVRVTVLG
jgi:hypothetical protein